MSGTVDGQGSGVDASEAWPASAAPLIAACRTFTLPRLVGAGRDQETESFLLFASSPSVSVSSALFSIKTCTTSTGLGIIGYRFRNYSQT